MNLALDDDFGNCTNEEYEEFIESRLPVDDGWTEEELADAAESYDAFVRAVLSGDIYEFSDELIKFGGEWTSRSDGPF